MMTVGQSFIPQSRTLLQIDADFRTILLPMKNHKRASTAGWTRREWLQAGTVASFASWFGPAAFAQSPLPIRGKGPKVYERLGVTPFINGTSTRTMNGGSMMLPEVIEAIYEASFYQVNLDELLPRASARLAELLQAPGVVVASGAAGAMTLATLACMAGGDFEVLQQLPNTDGLKNEVVAHRPSRSIYDHAIRMTGARMINVERPEDLSRAFGSRTCLAYAGVLIQAPESLVSLDAFVAAAHAHDVPVLIDAATDLPLSPDPYLRRGVDFVAYSGGKSLKGPQSAGLLVCSRKDLAQAACVAGAPYHTFARPLKVSKEEVIGLVAAVEALGTTRNISAEYDEYRRWYRHIIAQITKVPGVSARIIEPSWAGEYPVMSVTWDQRKIGWVAREIGEQLLGGKPRIMTHAFPKELDPTSMETNEFLIRPMALQAGEYRVVAQRLYELFKHAPGPKPPRQPAAPAGRIAGRWDVEVTFAASRARHRLELRAAANAISGVHHSRLAEGKVAGEIDGDTAVFESRGMYEAADIRYYFKGKLQGDKMSGELVLGEYGRAKWTAQRVG